MSTTTPKSPRTQRRQHASSVQEQRVGAVQREVLTRLANDDRLVDSLVEELEASMRGGGRTSGRGGDASTRASQEAQASIKALLEQVLRQQQQPRGPSGSNLLGELRQHLDLEAIVARRCWELMEEGWFDQILGDTEPG